MRSCRPDSVGYEPAVQQLPIDQKDACHTVEDVQADDCSPFVGPPRLPSTHKVIHGLADS